MSQVCTICKHTSLLEINQALLKGEAYRNIAKRFEASESAVFRHGRDHISEMLVKAKEAAEEVQADTLFERLRAINRETSAILKAARESENHVIALQAIARVERQVELEARLLGQLSDAAKIAVGITVNPPPSTIDYSLLSDEEIDLIERLVEKATKRPS